jgi:hypothetical protein
MAALSWCLLTSSGLFPILGYTLPAIAGLVLVGVAFENGVKWAYVSYLAVSLLCCMLSTDLEAVLLFVTLFGYYPILRLKLQVMRPKWVVALLKGLLFHLAVVVNLIGVLMIMGPGYLGLNLNSLTTPILLGIYGMIMVTLILYDMAIGVITRYYVCFLRPRFKKRIE